MKVLVIDIGGTHVKLLATGQDEPVKFVSGPKLTPAQMVAGVKKLGRGWKYQAISMGYPGLVLHGRGGGASHKPRRGWGALHPPSAFWRPAPNLNSAPLQAPR